MIEEIKEIWNKFYAYLDTDAAVQVAWRVLIFEIVVMIILNIILCNTNYMDFEALPILNLLVSVISIIIAIVVTYLFSKLFAEKAERIQRKQSIDELAHKVTLFRKIAFHIKGMHRFWETCNSNPKGWLDSRKYRDLTYHEYRNNLSYDDTHAIDEEVGGNVQPYLALKGLENNEHMFSFYSPFRPTNYSLEEITDFNEYAGSFWYFLDRSGQHVHFDNVHNYWKRDVNNYFKEIMGRELDTSNYRMEIKQLFNDIQGEVFDKLFYLTKLNEKRLPKLFLSGLTNLLIFLVILIISLVTSVINITPIDSYYTTVILLSLFIANTVDLIVIIWMALKTELIIRDFYKV
ncbi:MAG: hypothetical protein KDC67_03470 [Ignavibacteriae bacterium]|nr:hypothetical protein [Ignavibacteriota bacterium]